jgi:peptide chain release factor 1
MLDRLKGVEDRYEELNILLGDPSMFSDQERYQKIVKEHAELSPIVDRYRAYAQTVREIEEGRELMTGATDHEFRELVREDLNRLEALSVELEGQLRELIAPRDPNDNRNVIVEIRGGAGGEEAALFAAVLYRMYTQYATRLGWKHEILDLNETEIGGFKEVIFSIDGKGAYSRLKYESGVHRVQRVPVTESGGRIHTSTVTVAVLPEADEVDVEINPNDLEIDTYRASGAGGQHINKTESAIRITHKPSGMVVTCQDQRSQYKNKDKAMMVLRSRLFEAAIAKQAGAIAADRKSQVGTGDRSERIRTYNYPQSRVTDHRIGLTLYKIDSILEGDLDDVINALVAADRADALGRGDAED